MGNIFQTVVFGELLAAESKPDSDVASVQVTQGDPHIRQW